MTESSFAEFCKSKKIACNKIRWHVRGDRHVKVTVLKEDLEDNQWSLVGIALQFALKEIGIECDLAIRENEGKLDIIVER